MIAKKFVLIISALALFAVAVPLHVDAFASPRHHRAVHKAKRVVRHPHGTKRVAKRHVRRGCRYALRHRGHAGPAIVETKDLNPNNFHAGLVADADDDTIFFIKNIGERWPIASLTKLMVVLILDEKIDRNQAHWSDVVTISRDASLQGGSQVYLKQGEHFTLAELLKAIMIMSANDAAYAVAEYLGGGDCARFVTMMNQRARQLGMKDTVYYNPNGLPPDTRHRGEENVSTTRDLYLLARAIVRHPDIFQFSSIKKDTFRDGKIMLVTTNKLLLKSYPGLDGLKTGYYRKAGFNFIATAKRNNTRLVAIVLGAKSNSERFNEAARLLDIGFEEISDRSTTARSARFNLGGNTGIKSN